MADAGIVAVAVRSEYTRIPVAVEFAHEKTEAKDLDSWDRVIECPTATASKRLVFVGCTDDVGFGVVELPSDSYRLRIHYGGQDSVRPDGESADFYLVQIWPDDDTSSRVIKARD